MENLIYTVLLAIHNIALVGCAAAPFYNLRLVTERGREGRKIFYELDKVVENTIQGLEPYCWTFIIVLFITGFGFPAVHYAFHGGLKDFNTVVFSFFIVKHLFVIGMVAIAFYITFYINPKIKEIFLTFSPGVVPGEMKVKEFFAMRGRRKRLCKVCLVFAILVLVVSPVLRFYG